MDLFQIVAVLITLTAGFSYVNARWLKLPASIGLMLMSLVLSVVLIALSLAGAPLGKYLPGLMEQIDFGVLVLRGMLGFLLFAGALHVKLDDLAENKWQIATFATVGLAISTFVVGTLTYLLLRAAGFDLAYIHCLLFGALISPTDPIAVLAIMRKVGAPRRLETEITGESLFNDGIGVVVFLTLLEVAGGSREFGAADMVHLFAQEAVGGIVLGLALGYAGYRLIKSLDNYRVEALITLALVTGGYALADVLGASGPLAMVVAGLLIGNPGRRLAMSARTREHLDIFWELVDEVLNALLFVLIGLEALVIQHLAGTNLLPWLGAGLAAIPIVLLARLASIGIPRWLLSFRMSFPRGTVRVLTWGGLRGGLCIAMALSLPRNTEAEQSVRNLILTMTYVVVAFSILVQGLTINRLVKKTLPAAGA